VVGLAAVAYVGLRRLGEVDEPRPGLYVPTDHPVAIVALPGGGFRYGLRKGLVYEIGADGKSKGLLAELDVATNDELGLMGLAVDTSGRRTFATWADSDGSLQVSELTQGGVRPVWRGSSLKAGSVASAAWTSGGRLVVGTGNAADRDGRVIELDPDGLPDQTPRVVSSGWYPPMALARDHGGNLWVADQPPAKLRVARGDDPGGQPNDVTTEDGSLRPTGLAAESDAGLLVCLAAESTLQRVSVDGDGQPAFAATGIAPCESAVAVLSDGRLALGLPNGIVVRDDPGSGAGAGA